MEEELNYKTMRKIQELEKKSPTLSELSDDFYQELSKYIDSLEQRVIKEESDQKKNLLKDEVQNIKKIAINIYEHREKKIILASISKIRGGNPDLKHLIEDEKELFDSVYNIMNKSRKSLLDNKKEEKNLKELKEEISKEQNNEVKENDNPILSINKNIPEFVGTDTKKYNLRKNDLISLPSETSNMLVKRGVAKEIKV